MQHFDQRSTGWNRAGDLHGENLERSVRGLVSRHRKLWVERSAVQDGTQRPRKGEASASCARLHTYDDSDLLGSRQGVLENEAERRM